MRILLVTQNDYFLINQYSIELLRNLTALGVEVAVLVTPASSDGRKASARENIAKVSALFGWPFLLKVLIASVRGYVRHNLRRWCRKHGVQVTDVGFGNINDEAFVSLLARAEYDAALILAGNRIIRRNFLDAFKGHVVNVHTALLPYARGLMPAFWTLKADKGKGVTLFRLDEKIDEGEIIRQVALPDVRDVTLVGYMHMTKRVGIGLLLYYVMSRLEASGGPVEESYYKYPTRPDVVEFTRTHRLI